MARSKRLACLIVGISALAPALAYSAHAATGKSDQTEVGRARLNGYWEIDDDSRRNTVRPQLTPAAQAIAKRNAEAQAARTARGEVVGLGSYTCGLNGVPFVYTASEPVALVVTKDEVVQVAERPSMTPLHFYTDGRDWPDLSKMGPSSNGYSIAHWDGADLIVETRGMTAGGIPGGAVKGPKTVMRQRYHVTEDGKQLKLGFTFEDPDYLLAPYSFEYTYMRDPPHTYAFTDFCDPHDDRGEPASFTNPGAAK